MSPRLRLLATINTPTSANPIAISYDTICAAERRHPRNAYFELDAQPARMMPYTPIDVIASMYKRPALMLDSTSDSENGITAHAASAGASDNIGAMKNSQRLAPVGTTISLNSILSTSANGCSSPSGPTRLGPIRTCIQPMTLRSASVKYATERMSGMAIATILASVQIPGHTGPTNDHTGSHQGPHIVANALSTCCSIIDRAPPRWARRYASRSFLRAVSRTTTPGRPKAAAEA